MSLSNDAKYVTELVAHLGLTPLEREGGLYRQVYHDELSTAIYYLLRSPDFSALHLLTTAEVYHWYQGSPLQLVVIEADGTLHKPVLGPDVIGGQCHQYAVPGGTWHGSFPLGDWSLVGTTMAPPFSWDGFELGERGKLLEEFPHAHQEIMQLTR